MKKFLPTGAIVIALAVSISLRAQDAALPQPEKKDPIEPALLVTPTAAPSIPPRQLIPNDVLAPAPSVPSVPSIPQLDEGFKPAPLNQASDLQRKHVEWRRIRNSIQNDREVKAALQQAEEAKTDLEKRTLLRLYYNLLFRKAFARSGPEMQSYLADRKKDALKALAQRHVRPSASDKSLFEASSPSPSPSSSPSDSAPLDQESPPPAVGVQP